MPMFDSGDMTWGQFKKLLEEAGIQDDMAIWYIDVSYPRDLRINLPASAKTLGFTVTG